MKNIILIATIAAVLVAGCTGQTLPWNTGTGSTNIDSADLITASNEPVIPANPAADTQFTARFTVKNQHAEKTANAVSVGIYDTGKCIMLKIGGETPVKSTDGSWEGLNIVTAGNERQHEEDFSPGQQESIKLDMKAPKTNEIGGLAYSCPIRYKISYGFQAASTVTLDIISSDRIKLIEAQTGERPVYSRTLNVGPGPLRVLMEPISTLPVEAMMPIKFEITVKNEGTGDYAVVNPRELILKVPSEFEPIADGNGKMCGGFFELYDAKGVEGNAIYRNYRSIDLIEKQSNPITCEFTAPNVYVEKEYAAITELPYSYSYFGEEISVPIKP